MREKIMTDQDHRDIQSFLQKKQAFFQKAMDNLNKQDYKMAVTSLNIEQGFGVSINKILEDYVPVESTESTGSTCTERNAEIEDDSPSMYEDCTELEGEW